MVPRQLPAATAYFTGREEELAALTRILDRDVAQAPGTVVISAIGGMAGAGKTALAVHWAHQAASRFPDGQLYVNLRGFDPLAPQPPPARLLAVSWTRPACRPGRSRPALMPRPGSTAVS